MRDTTYPALLDSKSRRQNGLLNTLGVQVWLQVKILLVLDILRVIVSLRDPCNRTPCKIQPRVQSKSSRVLLSMAPQGLASGLSSFFVVHWASQGIAGRAESSSIAKPGTEVYLDPKRNSRFGSCLKASIYHMPNCEYSRI